MYIYVQGSGSAMETALSDVRRIQAFKGFLPKEIWRHEGITVAGFGRHRASVCPMAEIPGQVWAIAVGCWVHRLGIRSDDLPALLNRYLSIGADELAMELDGVFVLAIVDLRQSRLTFITDPCGSFHLYRRDDELGSAFATSPAGLSREGRLNPIAVHEFVAGGIIYEDRSIWEGVTKLPPGSVVEVDVRSRKVVQRRHWDIARINSESLVLTDAVEALHAAMTDSLRAIGKSFDRIAADLTGGYDSRMLLSGLLASGALFQSTVSGSANSPDVLVARGLAQALGRTVVHSAPVPGVSADLLDRAVRMSDGECDAFDTARILTTHVPASNQFDISLNGSFGEIARGYWWELLWPNLGVVTPLDTSMVAHKRFSAVPYDTSLFAGSAAFGFKAHMDEVVRRAVSDLGHLPNTSQMDGLYFRLRMQRWQGRIASTTNQLWPAISPMAFRAVLKPMLEARADARFRSLLPRAMFAQKNQILADFPLEHGYPPRPFTWAKATHYLPVVTYYGRKVLGRITSKLPQRRTSVNPVSVWQRHARAFESSPLSDWLASPMLVNAGHFHAERLTQALDVTRPLTGAALDHWSRIVTLEYALRCWGQASAFAKSASPDRDSIYVGTHQGAAGTIES